MRLYLSRKTHVLMITILFVSQVVASYLPNLYTTLAGTIVSILILIFYLNYSRLHTSSSEVYALFHLLSLVIVTGALVSLMIQIVWKQLTLYTTLYAGTLVLSVTLVNLTMIHLRRIS